MQNQSKGKKTNLICIFGCPIIPQRNVMNTVILAKISHHIIMRSEQVFEITVETPLSVKKKWQKIYMLFIYQLQWEPICMTIKIV